MIKLIKIEVEHRIIFSPKPNERITKILYKLTALTMKQALFQKLFNQTTQKRVGNPTNLITLGKNQIEQGKIGAKQLCDIIYAGSRLSFNTRLVVGGKSMVGGCWQKS